MREEKHCKVEALEGTVQAVHFIQALLHIPLSLSLTHTHTTYIIDGIHSSC
jgi:hypothetical protein